MCNTLSLCCVTVTASPVTLEESWACRVHLWTDLPHHVTEHLALELSWTEKRAALHLSSEWHKWLHSATWSTKNRYYECTVQNTVYTHRWRIGNDIIPCCFWTTYLPQCEFQFLRLIGRVHWYLWGQKMFSLQRRIPPIITAWIHILCFIDRPL